MIDQDGRIVPPGERGEICVRGYSVMRGYWGDEDKTSDAIDAAGWMHTGDLGTLDDQGYLNIVGRAKDMVIRGGENIYPREIEEFFYRHPKIQDVQIVGVPDPKYGEELCAWVKLREGEAATVEEIQAFCKGQIDPLAQIPRHTGHVRGRACRPMTVTVVNDPEVQNPRGNDPHKLGLMEADHRPPDRRRPVWRIGWTRPFIMRRDTGWPARCAATSSSRTARPVGLSAEWRHPGCLSEPRCRAEHAFEDRSAAIRFDSALLKSLGLRPQ